jgi:histidinol-phosphate aminotransferase
VIAPKAEDLGHDLDAMQRAITNNTKLIFVANPNNPTGSFLSGEQIAQFLKKVPEQVVVVLDEAYNEYLKPEQQYDAIAMVRQYPNLIVSRSFSKAYGLAGLRLGYAVSQEAMTDLMNRIRQPFNVNTLAQAAAIAALQDTAFLAKGAQLNQEGYVQLTQAFQKMGLHYLPSAGNFILVQVGDDDSAGSRVNLELLKQGVIVRPVDNYGLPKFLRVSIGLPEENAAFIRALANALAK